MNPIKVLQRLQAAHDRFETEVRTILRETVKADDTLAAQMIDGWKISKNGASSEPKKKRGRPRKKLHWTQRPENAAKVQKMSRKATRTREGARG